MNQKIRRKEEKRILGVGVKEYQKNEERNECISQNFDERLLAKAPGKLLCFDCRTLMFKSQRLDFYYSSDGGTLEMGLNLM